MTGLLNLFCFSGLQTFAECPEKTEGQILNRRDVHEATVGLYGAEPTSTVQISSE